MVVVKLREAPRHHPATPVPNGDPDPNKEINKREGKKKRKEGRGEKKQETIGGARKDSGPVSPAFSPRFPLGRRG